MQTVILPFGQGGLEPGPRHCSRHFFWWDGAGYQYGQTGHTSFGIGPEHRGLKPAECAMVGDSITIDIVAAIVWATTILVLAEMRLKASYVTGDPGKAT